MAKLNKKDTTEFQQTILWAMDNMIVKDEKTMNDYSTLSITLLRACNNIVDLDDLISVEDIIISMKNRGEVI